MTCNTPKSKTTTELQLHQGIKTMKTLYGITFAQLNNLTTAQLNEHMAVYTTNQVREAITETWPADGKSQIEEFLSVYKKHLLELFHNKFDDELYAGQRTLYNTEERFNFAVDMTARMGNVSTLVGGLMDKVMEELLSKK